MTHLHKPFALTDLQPDRICVRYHRYPTQKQRELRSTVRVKLLKGVEKELPLSNAKQLLNSIVTK